MQGRMLGPLQHMPGGAEVLAICENGERAMSAIREHKPDIALLDVQMILMTGLEVARVCREENLCKVLLVTSMAQRASGRSGEFHCLVKPFSSMQLYHAIYEALNAVD